MLVSESKCVACGAEFKVNDVVVRVETIYRIGNVHTEATEKGAFAHLSCPSPDDQNLGLCGIRVNGDPCRAPLGRGGWEKVGHARYDRMHCEVHGLVFLKPRVED